MKNIEYLLRMQYINMMSMYKTIILTLSLGIISSLIFPELLLVSIIAVFFVVMFSSLGEEKRCNVDNLVRSLPVSNKEYIFSRYLFNIISSIISIIIITILSIIIKDSIDLTIGMVFLLELFYVGVLLSITLPRTLFYDFKKVNALDYYLIIIPMVLIVNSTWKLTIESFPSTNIYVLIILGIICLVICVFFSYVVVLHIYERKEYS